MTEEVEQSSKFNSPLPHTNWLVFCFIVFLAFVVLFVVGIIFLKPNLNFQGKSANEPSKIIITKDKLTPDTLKIKQGTTVTWVNKDTDPHQIAADPHPTHTSYKELGDGEVLGEGESLTITYEKTGTYTYHDHFNPLKIRGEVIVE